MPNIILSLTIICLISGIALSAANKYTANAIAATKEAELKNAIQNVTPEFDNNPLEEAYTIDVTEKDFLTVYQARKGGQFVGCAVVSYSKQGFSGLIRVLVGFDAEGKVFNYSVLEHNETPGLGSKMEVWFRQNRNRQNVIGRDMTEGMLRLTKDRGDIDAITAATISSRAFLDAINIAYFGLMGNLDAISGPTQAAENVLNNETVGDINNETD